MAEKAAISIFIRVKPTESSVRGTPYCTIGEEHTTLAIALPPPEEEQYVNNMKDVYGYRFTEIMGAGSSQEEVFEKVAKPSILR
jgi:hypothetical protein